MFTSLALAISLLAVLPAMSASAYYNNTYGDYQYDMLQNGTVEIVGYTGNATSITIPSTIGAGKAKVTSIGDDAFNGCSDITKVVIPSTVTKIGNGAFYACSKLASVNIPSSVTLIDDWAFAYCESLTSIRIPGSVKTIGETAFYGCDVLKSVGLGSGIQEIGKFAFEDCPALKYVTIPKSVTNIGEYAFASTYDSNTEQDKTVSGFKINCYSGSVAQSYAKAFGIPYNLITATVTAPANVTGLKAAATSTNAVKLTCNKVAGATGYVFYRAINGKWVRVGVTKANAFLNKSLLSGTNYRYAVKAFKTVGGKNYYSKSWTTLWTSTKPATVNFTVTPGAGKAVLRWVNTRGATGYYVYLKTSANGKWLLQSGTKFNSMTIGGLTRGKTYWFTVRSVRTALGKNYWGGMAVKSAKAK